MPNNLVSALLKRIISNFLLWMAKPTLKATGDAELVYEKLAKLGFAWEYLVKSMRTLGIDDIILVPSKSKLVYIPLNMSTSERPVASVFKPCLGETVIDVGAYFGRYSLTSSKAVGPSGKVISVEAHPSNFQILKKNLIINKGQNVIPLNIAVSNREGRIKLYVAPSSGWHSIIDLQKDSAAFLEVPCTTLDNLLKGLSISKVDWLKIDVEGAEQMVLEGSKGTLSQNKNLKIVLEIHPRVADERAVLSLLERLNYTVRNIEPSHNEKPYHVLASRSHPAF
jgi:FkbM family methyltransferase